MGLKTKNYRVKRLDLVLPQAYAYVTNLTLSGTQGEARVVIQQDREKALTLDPIEEFIVTFQADRCDNPSYTTVYEILKGKKWVRSNACGKLQGWKDDIVKEDLIDS